jgi:hypothetical protein
LGGLTNSALLVNLGAPDSIAPGMRADTLAATGGQVSYVGLPDTYHFAFLAECSPLGWAVIALAGDDNICADHGTRDRRRCMRSSPKSSADSFRAGCFPDDPAGLRRKGLTSPANRHNHPHPARESFACAGFAPAA